MEISKFPSLGTKQLSLKSLVQAGRDKLARVAHPKKIEWSWMVSFAEIGISRENIPFVTYLPTAPFAHRWEGLPTVSLVSEPVLALVYPPTSTHPDPGF